MRKALIGALVGFSTLLTLGGLSVASYLTADVTLTVDGQTATLRVLNGETVGQLLSARRVPVADQDFLYPALDTVIADGLTIEVSHARPFTATIDGATHTITTTANTVGTALVTMGVTPGSEVSVSPQTTITPDGTSVTVATSKMISLRFDGATLYTLTTADTVSQLLADRGVTLGSTDRVFPSASATLSDDMAIVVQRVSVEKRLTTIQLAFATKTINDSKLAAGTTKVVTPGVVGKATQEWRVTTVDGIVANRTLLSQKTITKPVTQVVRVGTKATTAAATNSTVPAPNVAPGSAQDIARQMLPKYGWGDDQFGCLVKLWDRESHWNYKAQNKYSGAYGIPQALPGSKMASAGKDWKTNPATQIKWGLGYIKGRYGSPCSAWSHSQSTGWY